MIGRHGVIPLYRRTWYVKSRGRRWVVIRQGAAAVDSVHDEKEAAITRGIDLAQRTRGRLRVKARDGRVLDDRFFG